MPPRDIFRPRGAGGGAVDRTREAFQPGDTEGILDPNEGRFGARICGALVRRSAWIYAPQAIRSAIIHDACVRPSAEVFTAQVRPVSC